MVLIVDAAESDTLLQYLRPWHPVIYCTRGEQINVPVLLASLLRKGKRADAYRDCYIEKVCPRVAVTMTDNNPVFYSLSRRHKGIKTMFIQGGVRGYYGLFCLLGRMRQAQQRFNVDYMMVFGKHIGAEYAKYIEGRTVSLGSIKNNMISKTRSKRSGTIAFVSQYRNIQNIIIGDKSFSFDTFFGQADKLVLGFLLEYAKKHDKDLVIVPCSNVAWGQNLEGEAKYFRDLVGQTVDFSPAEGIYASYTMLDSIEVVVGIDSTLVYESAARGNKTAIFSIRGKLMGIEDRDFGWPESYSDEGPFWTNLPDTSIFERILDHLFGIDDEQWKNELEECSFSDVMAYDPGNTALQSVLRHELGEPGSDCIDLGNACGNEAMAKDCIVESESSHITNSQGLV